MKKLSTEQLDKISKEIFNEYFPEENNENQASKAMVELILNAITKFTIKYQDEIEE